MLIADGPAARRAGVPTAAGSHAITIAGNVGRDVGDSVMEMQAAVSYWRPWGGTVGRRLARLVSPVVFWTVLIAPPVATSAAAPEFGQQVSPDGIRHAFLVTGAKTAIIGENNQIVWQVDRRLARCARGACADNQRQDTSLSTAEMIDVETTTQWVAIGGSARVLSRGEANVLPETNCETQEL